MNQSSPFLSLIVARSQNGVIGRNNTMPWHLPSDLQHFKTITMGKPVIMGRKTYHSIGKPLIGRTNIIMTRGNSTDQSVPPSSQILLAYSFEQARELAHAQAAKDNINEIFVIGGAEIFKQAFALAQRLYITEILADIAGDTFFPSFDSQKWRIVMRGSVKQEAQDSHKTQFFIYEKS